MFVARMMLLVLVALPAVGPAWGWEEAQLRVDRPRPVLAAIRLLEERYGWLTNYEDPPYTNPADVVELSPTLTGSRKIVAPRSGRIEIAYPLVSDTGMPESQSAILNMVLDDNARRDNAGHFRMRVVGGMICVVPEQGSILDVPITLAPRQRTFQGVADEIVASVRSATGLRFRSPVVSRATATRFEFAASGEPASSVLLRLFAAAGGRYSWALLYLPDSGFELNITGRQGE